MRSVFYGTLFTILVACSGAVQAENKLDGQALFCVSDPKFQSRHLVYGFVFENGEISRHVINGYSKVVEYTFKYVLRGTNEVAWYSGYWRKLDRETLKHQGDQCYISSKKEIFQKLDEAISLAENENKI